MRYPIGSTEGVIASAIARDPVGRKLTPEAHERAVRFAADTWRGTVNVGQAVEAGIRHVTADGPFREER